MKKLFHRSTSLFLSCLVVFLGSCFFSAMGVGHANDGHHHSHEETHHSSHETPDHDHSDGEHCVGEDFFAVTNGIRHLHQEISSTAVLPFTREYFVYEKRFLHQNILFIVYDPGIQSYFQEHIRSVLIRV